MMIPERGLIHGFSLGPFASLKIGKAPEHWSISHLTSLPEEEWQRMRDFLALSAEEREAMLRTVEPLFRRGHELVVGRYDYLLANAETAAILGWESGADPGHLAERRQFFTIWLARLLGMDFSHDFARYLFHAGKMHAAHGPRQTHVPALYVAGSISLVNAAFARFLREEASQSRLGEQTMATALAGWNKVLSMHLHLMQMGYDAAVAIDSGNVELRFSLFGKLRSILRTRHLVVHVSSDATVETALQKFFNYYPTARAEIFDVEWVGGERIDTRGTPWFTTTPAYTVKPSWRALLNGKDIAFYGGVKSPVHTGDEIHLFPPGG